MADNQIDKKQLKQEFRERYDHKYGLMESDVLPLNQENMLGHNDAPTDLSRQIACRGLIVYGLIFLIFGGLVLGLTLLFFLQ